MSEGLRVGTPPAKPVMVYDADCNFCKRWICRWQQSTGDKIDYIPLQDPHLEKRFPEVPREACEQAVHLIESDGRVSRGAEAVFRALAYNRFKRWPLWIYQKLPGIAPFIDVFYRFVARHRTLFSFLTRMGWGEHVGIPSYLLVRAVFLRGLGAIYLVAFVSLWLQILGLIGQDGILPVRDHMESVRAYVQEEHVGASRYLIEPTFCWISDSDASLHVQCALGTVLSLCVIIGLAPVPCLLLLWLLYLSLTTAAQVFLGYQWDNLLLEAGFLAIFLAPLRWRPNLSREYAPSKTALWLLRWLMFRLMFESGLVKLASGDVRWRDLTALEVHYQTQPLPTWIGYFAHHLPLWLQQTSAATVFGIELVLPFVIFLPRRFRVRAVWGVVFLQVLIALTGNYGFFNYLSILLCLPLLDDAGLLKVIPGRWRGRWQMILESHPVPGADSGNASLSLPAAPVRPRGTPAEILRRITMGAVTLWVAVLSVVHLWGMLGGGVRWPAFVVSLYRWEAPFRTINTYGLFAVMTTSRPEIIIEGSNDRTNWLAYEFKYKPGDLTERPRFVAPHQPRLDWQMWFAALGSYRQNPWFVAFCRRLLEGSPRVLGLLEKNPFPDAPPRYVRAVVYDYQFTTIHTQRTQGSWWRRQRQGDYIPAISLENFRPAPP